jgi:predicted Zn-dependent protease
MDPGDTAALVSLSEVRLRAGDRAQAAELRARAYELEPSRAPVVAAHAALLLELGDSAGARDVLTSAAAVRLEFHNREQAVMLLRSLEQLSRRADAPRAAADFAGQAVRRARGGTPAAE